MVLRISVARSAIESLRDICLGILLGLALALAGLAWMLAPRMAEFSPRLANLLGGN